MRVSVLIVTLLFLIGCSNKENTFEFYDAVNNNLIKIIDTNSVFKYGSFQIPPQEIFKNHKKLENYNIKFKEKIEYSKDTDRDILKLIQQYNFDKKFSNIIIEKNKLKIKKLDLLKLHKIKKISYSYSKNGDEDIEIVKNCVGQIIMSNIYINSDVGIICYSKATSIKSGTDYIVFLEKTNNKWKILKNIETGRW